MVILTNIAKQCEAQECLDMFGPKWPSDIDSLF
jgi:hypothetical protein